MERDDHIIVGVHVTERVKHVTFVQKVLTEFGCYIKTRLGLHTASDDFCSSSGLILLEMLDNKEIINSLIEQLNDIEGVEAKMISFSH